MGILTLIIIGAAAGYLAARMLRIGEDPLLTVGLGIVGAVLGGLLLRVVAAVLGWIAVLLGAVAGALLLIWLWQGRGRRR
ncbi:GlsB/YeaQ/YmgE family stress response membrane protein [Frigidibacter oleivorans]|uniref:GlsB/YeaQ/YmgE family stress response membrane protein n=1 Tax=Frigidibacter oleivorans TaxID=2487129 RepID=UPI000F8D68B2|nr:GlsB/YeaQ/YmgE family stress response membrane protein [Frigidibacter oleivorans]